jgi:hypothetical protein
MEMKELVRDNNGCALCGCLSSDATVCYFMHDLQGYSIEEVIEKGLRCTCPCHSEGRLGKPSC